MHARVASGVLRGCGRQSWGAGVNVAFFWFLGLPLAWVLGFKAGYGIEGMWAGLSIATTLQVLSWTLNPEAKGYEIVCAMTYVLRIYACGVSTLIPNFIAPDFGNQIVITIFMVSGPWQ